MERWGLPVTSALSSRSRGGLGRYSFDFPRLLTAALATFPRGGGLRLCAQSVSAFRRENRGSQGESHKEAVEWCGSRCPVQVVGGPLQAGCTLEKTGRIAGVYMRSNDHAAV